MSSGASSSPARLSIRRDATSSTQSDPAVDWAMDAVSRALAELGIAIVAAEPDGEADVELATIETQVDTTAESYTVSDREGGTGVVLSAGDARGFTYGLLDLIDAAQPSSTPARVLDRLRRGTHPAAVPVRGIQRNFSNVDHDSVWLHDREFWTEYLDWLALSRFNRFHLAFAMQYNYSHDTVTDNYFGLVYPFLFKVDGFEVFAAGVDDAEQRRNLESLRYIAAETKRRGLHFQLGLWNHAYDYGAESEQRFPISGVNDDNHADYSAAALAKLLEEVPGIDGFTFRVHYEGGIPEAGHEIFWDKVFTAASDSGHELEIDMHAKGVDQLLLDSLAHKPGLRPVISAKYWAEHCGLPYHQTSIRAREAARPADASADLRGVTNFSRRFTRYGYGDFLSEDREAELMFRIWPGTQRVLLGGSPELAAGFGRMVTFGGARGMDICEPLSFKSRDDTADRGSRDPYADSELQLGTGDWKKYKYGYLLSGRLMHDPDADPQVWRRYLAQVYGAQAEKVESALNSLSKILPLMTVAHGASGSNNLYWPEVYNNLPISSRIFAGAPISERKVDPIAEKYGISYAYSVYVDDKAKGRVRYTDAEERELLTEILFHDTDDVRHWGGISPFDPGLFYAVDEYVADLLRGELRPKYTPEEVAQWLERLVGSATGDLADLERALTATDVAGDRAQLRRTVVDLEILARIGTFFAAKFRSAVHYSIFQSTGDRSALEESIAAYLPGRDAFAEIGEIAAGVYQPDLSFGKEPYERGTWADRLPEVDRDLAALRSELAAAPDRGRTAVQQVSARPSAGLLSHQPITAFERGAPLTISAQGAAEIESVTLCYRHVDQSKPLRDVVMIRTEDGFAATIDPSYTDTTYPLMYFFSITDRHGGQTFAPGLDAQLANQPYYLVHSTAYRR